MVCPFFVSNDFRKPSNWKYGVVITYQTVRNGQIVHVRTTKCKTHDVPKRLRYRKKKKKILFSVSRSRKATRNRNINKTIETAEMNFIVDSWSRYPYGTIPLARSRILIYIYVYCTIAYTLSPNTGVRCTRRHFGRGLINVKRAAITANERKRTASWCRDERRRRSDRLFVV